MSGVNGTNNGGKDPLKFDPSQVPGVRPDRVKPNANASGQAGGAGTEGARGQAGAVHAMHAVQDGLKLLPNGDAAPAIARAMMKLGQAAEGQEARLALLDSRLGDATAKMSFLAEMQARGIKIAKLGDDDLARHVAEYLKAA